MGVRVREKNEGSGIYWVFVAHQGRRTSRKVGDRTVAREAARKIQARLTLGKGAFGEKANKLPAPRLRTTGSGLKRTTGAPLRQLPGAITKWGCGFISFPSWENIALMRSPNR